MKNTHVPITHSQQQKEYAPYGDVSVPPTSAAYPFPNRPPPSNHDAHRPPPGAGGGLLPPRYSANDMNYGSGDGWGGGHPGGVQGAYRAPREKGGRWTY
jgi:hypothetical protein